ncbi:MAG: phosphoribosylaminoimidazolesuccinocarboxamide synthase [Chloroflexi bacterium]|nr:phosphoribosylaminoimidazolesuccinocarboxamide synthase [Chloroflexota bacterium]
MADVILETALPVPRFARGKVRDIYDLVEHLLIVTTDRISAFDVVLPMGVPEKGRVLNQLSAFWFRRMGHLVPNHLITTDVTAYPAELQADSEMLAGRSMLVHKAERIEAECVVRGYLAGSGWRDYVRTGEVCGHKLPPGMVESQEFPEPIFTPATKAESGHDENISRAELASRIGTELAAQLESTSIEIYNFGRAEAQKAGLIVADTKFEFGLYEGALMLIDEAFTPDSSRYWDTDIYEPGHPQPSYDKEFVREWLRQSGWDMEPPAPTLPDDIIQRTSAKYQEALRRITAIPPETHS